MPDDFGPSPPCTHPKEARRRGHLHTDDCNACGTEGEWCDACGKVFED